MAISLPPPKRADERLEFALSLLVKRRAYVAALVIRLGEVRWTDSLTESAAVQVTDEGIRWWFNTEYFSKIDNFELAGIMVHEALHVAFRHHQRCPDTSQVYDRHLFNLACDAVINDLIARSFPELKLPDSAVTGNLLVGRNASSLTAEEVFRMLRKRDVEEPEKSRALLETLTPCDDHTSWISASDSEGSSMVETSFSDDFDRILRLYKASDPSVAKSSFGRSVSRETAKSPAVDLSLYLQDAIRFKVSHADWSRPNRKLSWLYPDLLLPNYPESSDQQVLIALDASGSVSSEMLNAAMRIARQPIVRAQITLISFDTNAYLVGENPMQIQGGGGTDVQAVEDFAVGMRGYPDTVFVITDGYTPIPKVKFPQRWVWILPLGGDVGSVPEGSRKLVLQSWEVGL